MTTTDAPPTPAPGRGRRTAATAGLALALLTGGLLAGATSAHAADDGPGLCHVRIRATILGTQEGVRGWPFLVTSTSDLVPSAGRVVSGDGGVVEVSASAPSGSTVDATTCEGVTVTPLARFAGQRDGDPIPVRNLDRLDVVTLTVPVDAGDVDAMLAAPGSTEVVGVPEEGEDGPPSPVATGASTPACRVTVRATVLGTDEGVRGWPFEVTSAAGLELSADHLVTGTDGTAQVTATAPEGSSLDARSCRGVVVRPLARYEGQRDGSVIEVTNPNLLDTVVISVPVSSGDVDYVLAAPGSTELVGVPEENSGAPASSAVAQDGSGPTTTSASPVAAPGPVSGPTGVGAGATTADETSTRSTGTPGTVGTHRRDGASGAQAAQGVTSLARTGSTAAAAVGAAGVLAALGTALVVAARRRGRA